LKAAPNPNSNIRVKTKKIPINPLRSVSSATFILCLFAAPSAVMAQTPVSWINPSTTTTTWASGNLSTVPDSQANATRWSSGFTPGINPGIAAQDVTIAGAGGESSSAITINFNNSLGINAINFTNPTNRVTLSNGSAADRTLNLGAGGLTTGAGNVVIGRSTLSGVAVGLAANQSWSIGAGDLTAHNRITGVGGLTKTGAGTLTMFGLSGGTSSVNGTDTGNTYAGGTTVEAGLLVVNTTMNDEGFLTVNGGEYRVGESDTVGAVTVSGGLLSRSGAAVLTGSSYALTGLATGTVSAVLAGSGGLTKTGAATATLSGENTTYSGEIVVSGGTLALANNAAAGTTAGGIAVSGSSVAILQINSGITTADDIVFSNSNAGSSVKRDVAAASAYDVGTSGTLKSSFAGGTPDTSARILGGTSSAATTLTMSFGTSSTAANDNRRSDVFSISGTGSDNYVLQILADGGIASDSFLAWLDGSNTWVAAGTNFVTGAYDSMTHTFGDYGFDSGNNSVWAVVNYGGSFAAVPEPTSALAGLLLGAGLLRRKRNTGG
jgi:fibronectin-binding autotransporter adhesin